MKNLDKQSIEKKILEKKKEILEDNLKIKNKIKDLQEYKELQLLLKRVKNLEEILFFQEKELKNILELEIKEQELSSLENKI